MKLLTPIAFFFLMFSLFFTGCKKEKLEEKAKEPSNVPTGSTDDTENSDGTDEKEENDSPTDALKLFQRLTNGVLQGEKEIDVREFNISSDKADSLYNCFIRNNPLLFHLKVSGNIGYRVDLQHPEYLQPLFLNTQYYLPLSMISIQLWKKPSKHSTWSWTIG